MQENRILKPTPFSPIARAVAFDRADPRAVRLARALAPLPASPRASRRGFVQGNVCILPRAFADDFRLYCERNPKPCPLVGMSEPGDPRVPSLGEDLDIAATCRATACSATAN